MDIKFRAFDKLNNKMLYVGQFKIKYEKDNGFHAGKFDTDGDYYQLELMQFTGKKDINGKDVYVGDKSKDGGVIEWYQDTCQFVIRFPCVEVQELKDCEKWLEVVGTIHDKN